VVLVPEWNRADVTIARHAGGRFAAGVGSFRAVAYGSSAFRTAAQRRQIACEAALAVAVDLGLTADGAVIVEDWNNTIIRLGTSGVVAKVGTSHFRDARLESLERELAVSTYLAACGAPVVPPTQEIPAGPHRWRGLTLTMWQYVEPAQGAEFRPAAAAAELKVVHEAMAEFDGRLPVFTVELDDAARFLGLDRSPALGADDREFLLRVIDELRRMLDRIEARYRPLHGSPHEANWLLSADGPLLLDFETACLGPREWDLSALDDDVVGLFPEADLELLGTLRRMRSVCVAAKCWVALDRGSEVREAAHVHLKLLRGERLD
jgi:Phosphotransferase enzyme family